MSPAENFSMVTLPRELRDSSYQLHVTLRKRKYGTGFTILFPVAESQTQYGTTVPMGWSNFRFRAGRSMGKYDAWKNWLRDARRSVGRDGSERSAARKSRLVKALDARRPDSLGTQYFRIICLMA